MGDVKHPRDYPPVRITYTNHRGATEVREVVPAFWWYGTSSYHGGEQYFMQAYCKSRKAFRDFAFKDNKSWEPL